MASPQIEDGYTKIANELLDNLCKIYLTNYGYRIFLFIVRKTYGFGKKEDMLSLSQISIGTNILTQNVCRTMKELIKLNVIKKKGGFFSIQKDYNKWVFSQKQVRKVILSDTIQQDNKISKKVILSDTILSDNKVILLDNPGLSCWIDTKETIQKKEGQLIQQPHKKNGVAFQVLQHFGTLYKNNLGITYHSNFAKDTKLIKNIISHYSKEFAKPEIFIENCISIMFDEVTRIKQLQSNSKWIETYDKWLLGDITIGLFYSKINKLAELRVKEKGGGL